MEERQKLLHDQIVRAVREIYGQRVNLESSKEVAAVLAFLTEAYGGRIRYAA